MTREEAIENAKWEAQTSLAYQGVWKIRDDFYEVEQYKAGDAERDFFYALVSPDGDVYFADSRLISEINYHVQQAKV